VPQSHTDADSSIHLSIERIYLMQRGTQEQQNDKKPSCCWDSRSYCVRCIIV